jgi:SUKH-3 immunity protein
VVGPRVSPGDPRQNRQRVIAGLAEFGGLSVVQDAPRRDLRRRRFAIDSTQVAATTETRADLGRLLQTSLFPMGMEGDHDSVFAVDEAGRIFALDHAGIWARAWLPR